MAYEDTHCPCGGHKLRETMLCDQCEAHLAERPENLIMRDPTTTWELPTTAAETKAAVAVGLHPVVSGRSDFQPAFLTGDSTEQREPTDYYKTPEHATRPLLAREKFDGIVWECACGDGAISRMLPGEVISTDLYNRGFGESGVDFLATTKQVNHVVTNPPYSLAQKFVEHALRCASGKVAMLLKLNFLEGQKRKPFFEATPLRTVYVFANRISFDKADVKGGGNGLLAYAWFVWEIGYQGKPTLEWIKSESANKALSESPENEPQR